MAQRFISKRPQNKYVRPIRNSQIVHKIHVAEQPNIDTVAEKKEKNEDTTMNSKIAQITQVLDTTSKGSTPRRRVKTEKKDKGLIERTEDSTILLTEDNKMLLND